MDNSEEYVLQVFRRAQVMLEDALMPEHVAKLLKLGEKFAQASDIENEAACLKYIEGFSMAGVAFEWLLGRARRDSEFNLEQFDADVNLLFEELHQAFSCESQEPIDWDEPWVPETSSALPEPDWNGQRAGAMHAVSASPAAVMEPDSPSFTDLLDPPMMLTVQRLADSAVSFNQKPPAERTTSLAVLKMMAKNVIDMSRPQNKVVVTAAFQNIAGCIESIERRGVGRDSAAEKTIVELGQLLSRALLDGSGGMRYMREITEFINGRKENGSK
jgi:hypothetical protein